MFRRLCLGSHCPSRTQVWRLWKWERRQVGGGGGACDQAAEEEPNTRTYFACAGQASCLDHRALGQSKRSHDSTLNQNLPAFQGPTLIIYLINHKRMGL